MFHAAHNHQGEGVEVGVVRIDLYLCISRYATLLASQGCLKSALSYLGDTSSNPQLQELKDRLEKAINAPVSTARYCGEEFPFYNIKSYPLSRKEDKIKIGI